jgi:hypothetical protein
MSPPPQGAPSSKIRFRGIYEEAKMEFTMSRTKQFDRRYGSNREAVLKSIAKVAAAGRWGDQANIDRERARHKLLMARLS